MERQMDNWNDARLDELSRAMKDGFAKVDQRFEKVDQRFERVEGEMKEGFAKVDQRFEKVDQRFEQMATKEELGEVKSSVGEVKAELRDLNNKLVAGAISLVVAILAGFALTLIT